MIKDSDRKWAKTKLADAASEIFRTLVVTREIPAVDAADLLSMAMSEAMFEATLTHFLIYVEDTSLPGLVAIPCRDTIRNGTR